MANMGSTFGKVAALGTIPGLVSAFKGSNPANKAMPYLDEAGKTVREGYMPYVQQGQEAYGHLQPQYGSMTDDPAAFLENILKGYQPSKSYGLKRDEALQAAGNTAAAGGMRGSLSDINNEARITDSLLGDDMQQWLQNVMGIQGRGMQGEHNFYNTGYDASSNMTSDLSNILGTQGTLAFQGRANKNQMQADLLNSLIKAGAAAASGGASGGAGAAAGAGGGGGWM